MQYDVVFKVVVDHVKEIILEFSIVCKGDKDSVETYGKSLKD